MIFLKYAAIAVLCISAIIIIGVSLKSGKPVKYLVVNALLGLAAFAAVDLTARFTGVHLALNEWTATGSAVFGVPAVCGLLILRIIFGA